MEGQCGKGQYGKVPIYIMIRKLRFKPKNGTAEASLASLDRTQGLYLTNSNTNPYPMKCILKGDK